MLKLYFKIKLFFLSLFLIHYKNFYTFILENNKISKSQLFQDLFVQYIFNKKKEGVFIEIGGGNGSDISNTILLEKKYDWKGIICEPNRYLQKIIKKNRTAKIESKPITKHCQNKIFFYENTDGYASSIFKSDSDNLSYKTKSICLNHLFIKYKLPNIIDYISLDTEGNELDIISKFNFKKYKVKIFTIEHNFNKDARSKVHSIMINNGYERIFSALSYMDDWFKIKD